MKIILLSGTIFKERYQRVIESFNFMKPLTEDYSDYNDDSNFLWNTIRTIPLKNVIKAFKCYKSHKILLFTATKILRWFAINRSSERYIVVCKERKTVQYLQSQLLDIALSVTGENDSKEKLNILDRFFHETNKKVLIGTKLVSEGYDIDTVRLILLVDFSPSTDVYLQACGRLRNDGVGLTIFSESTVVNHGLKDGFICKTIADFYRIKHDFIHHACYKNSVIIMK